jgi:hypothetical protein
VSIPAVIVRDLRDVEVDSFLAQAELLAQLRAHPAWDGWLVLLRNMRQAALEELARCTEPGDFRYWQGVAGAFGEMLDRPDRIIAHASEVIEAEESDRKVIRPELRSIVGAGFDEDGDV